MLFCFAKPFAMKKYLFCLLLFVAIPAMAQTGPHRGHHRHHSPHAPAYYHEHGMNSADFYRVVRIISDESFDKNRLSIAKQVIECNRMSVNQIAAICKLFTFEANRLEFAKYAYRHCTNQNKYFLLNKVFTFSSSKQELYDYIRELEN